MKDQGKQKRKRIRLASILIIIFLLIYVPSLLHWVFGKNISTDIIRIGLIEDSINIDGYIIRDEKVLISQFSGKYIPTVMEGEKASAKSKIATVLKESSIELLDKIEEYDSKIVEMQNEKNKNASIFSEDVIKIENQIDEKVKLIISESNNNSLGKLSSVEEDIDKLIKKKINIIGGMSSADVYIKELKNSREKVRRQIDLNTASAFTDLSGTVSYFVDGYEEKLTPESIEELTPEYLESIKYEEIAVDEKDRNVKADKPFAKMIYGNSYNIVFSIKEKDGENINVGNRVVLRINDLDKKIDGIVAYKSQVVNGKQILSVSVDRYLAETTRLRKINVDLIKKSSEGFRVPVKSLKDINKDNMTAKIAIIKANCSYIRDIKIELIYGDSAIVTNIDDVDKNGVSLYDTYIINPKNIEEGQIIVQ